MWTLAKVAARLAPYLDRADKIIVQAD